MCLCWDIVRAAATKRVCFQKEGSVKKTVVGGKMRAMGA